MALSRDHARIALATIRLVNGGLALLAPEVMLRRFEAGRQADPGAGPDPGRVAVYPLRMFGIRTVVLGIQLLASGPGPLNGSGPHSGSGAPNGAGALNGSGSLNGPGLRSGSLRQQGRAGIVIHAADAASAITAGLRRQLPARVWVAAAGISLTNTALAWILATGDPATGDPATDGPAMDGPGKGGPGNRE
jgi:hypothetical protein